MCISSCYVLSGDLYGSIGSPVRLSRTVVVGRRQELVQRLLYVLTYFIRCSELLETHMLDSAEDEAIVMPGSLITTSLRKGEVEESDYVLVTVHKPSGDYLSQDATTQEHQIGPEDSSYRSDNSLQSSTYTDTEVEHSADNTPREDEEEEDEEEEDEEDEEEDSRESQGSRSSVLQAAHGQENNLSRPGEEGEPGELYRESNNPLSKTARPETALCVGLALSREKVCVLDPETKGDFPSAPTTLTATPTPAAVESKNSGVEAGIETGTGDQFSRALSSRTLGNSLEKKPPDKSVVAALPVPVFLGNSTTGPMALTLAEEEPATKVTFLIGASMSPESDTESRRRNVEEEFKKHKKQLKDKHHLSLHQEREPDLKTSTSCTSEDQSKQTKGAPSLLRVSSKMPAWNPNCVEHFDEYFSVENPVETRTIDDTNKQPEDCNTDGQEDVHDPSGVTQLGGLGDHSSQGADRSQVLDFCLGPDSVDVGSRPEGRCRCGSTDLSDSCCCCQKCTEEHHGGLLLSLPVPQDGSSGSDKGDQKQKVLPINDWEIPRNESSDSALGDSETEETEDWQEEVLVPFPG